MICKYCGQEIQYDYTFGGWYDRTQDFGCRFFWGQPIYPKTHEPKELVAAPVSDAVSFESEVETAGIE